MRDAKFYSLSAFSKLGGGILFDGCNSICVN